MARLNCVTVLAPAKLNLALDVVGLLPGGYHDLDMTMQAITLYERVVLRRSPYLNLRLPGSLVAPNNKNTAIKAALAFFDYTGLLAGVDITIYKNTPVRAGMAGGSADAAAVLVGMNELYGAHLSMSELCALGAKIGADVPFALMGGTCRVQGVGDFLKALPPVPECWFTVVMPDYGVSTPEAFAAYDRVGSSVHPDCGAQEAAIRAGDLDALCAAAGKHQALKRHAGEARNLRQVAGRDDRRVLLQRAEQRRFVALFRVDGEVNKRRRGVVPLFEMHRVGEDRHHPVGARRDAARHLFEQGVGVHSHAFGNQLLFGAEGVAEPAHGQPGKEADRLCLRHAGDNVRVYADVHLRVGAHLRQVHHLLPEGAAQHRRLSGAHHAQPQTAQLHVAAAHHHRGALAQAALLCGCFGDGPQHGAGLFYRGEDIGAQPGHVEQRRTPVAGEEIQHARRARIGRVHRQLAGELRRQPVADHSNGGGFTINIRTMVRQPQQARHGAEGKRLAGNVIHFGFKPVVVDLFEFSYLSAGAGVDVGAGPDSLAVAVVQNNPFAHRTAGD